MRKVFLENLSLKIVAILLSLVLWFFATSRGQSEISLDVPLEFKNVPSGLEIVNNTVKSVRLNIKGQERLIKNIKAENIRVYIDLSKAKKGEGIYYINKDNIKLPYTVNVTNINPTYVKVLTEETITKTVKVKPVIVGTPERGFYLKAVEVVPQTVIIEGVQSVIKKINVIRTEPFDVTESNETLTQDLKLDLAGKNIRTDVDVVRVKVIIAGGKR
ncbi:MAG: CdaR family protein [Nitrospirota bacterium]